MIPIDAGENSDCVVEYERCLASVQKVSDVLPHQNAEKLEILRILGWKVVAQKGQFKTGDLCVYFELDSVLDETDEYFKDFTFLKREKFRVKTIRLRGQLSQGLVVPLDILQKRELIAPIVEGLNVTKILHVKKYVSPEESRVLKADAKGLFPDFLKKTDQKRLQSYPEVLNEIKQHLMICTVKYDGTSFTAFYKDGEYGICSRNMHLKDEVPSVYQCISDKLHLKETLIAISNNYNIKNIAIQGEICGVGVQGNKLELKELQFFVFDIFDIDNQKYLDFFDLEYICKYAGLRIVEVLDDLDHTFEYTVDNLLELAKGSYPTSTKNNPREGIVIRSYTEEYSSALDGRFSFKVINNDFLENFKN